MINITVPFFKYIDCSIADLKIDDQQMVVTSRFWDSLSSKYGLGTSIYKYFYPYEVFERLARTRPEKVRLTIQETQSQDEKSELNYQPKLLGISSAKNPCLKAEELYDVLSHLQPKPKSMEIIDGVIITKHNLHTPIALEINREKYESRLTLETPVDGYGRPNVWLTFRNPAGNYIIAYHKKFQTGINIGKHDDAAYTLKNVMEAYNNEDGFLAFRDRLTAAFNSWASAWETQGLNKLLVQLKKEDYRIDAGWVKDDGTPVEKYCSTMTRVYPGNPQRQFLESLERKTGDIREIYGVAQFDTIGQKKQRSLPTMAKVSDVINLAAEVAANLRPYAARKLQTYCGELLGEEYDLECSAIQYAEFKDFTK